MAEQEQLVQSVNVKSKFLNLNQERTFIVSPSESKIAISTSGNPNEFKSFHVDDVQSHQTDGNTLKIALNNGRTYQLTSQDSAKIAQSLNNSKNIELAKKFIQQKSSMAPKSINYFQAFNPLKYAFNPMQTIVQKVQTTNIPNEQAENKDKNAVSKVQATEKQQKPTNHQVAQYFLNSKDWRREERTGRVFLLNEEWKKNATKIVSFVIKKFVTTGSFMGISFPTFAMKPESILESYAKSIGVAPKLFTGVNDHLQRMKNFINFAFTISLLHIDIRKPFNPVIGETFQATIAGGSYTAEQICHHPPISAFFYEGKGYKIYSQLQLSASIGLNSGQGRFIGDITVQFQDGHWIKGRIPNGILCGFVMGETYFQCYGGAYAYDSEKVVATYESGKDHLIDGTIGYLRQKYSMKFKQNLKKQDRFIKFQKFSQDKYAEILSKFTAKVGIFINFDNRQFFSFDDQQNFPYLPQEIPNSHFLLQSDSRFRIDIKERKLLNIQRSQKQKEILQDEERRYRKLREKFKK